MIGTQDNVTLSSAQAELVAMGKAAMETLGIRSMVADWKMAASNEVSTIYADASAALGIAKRQGAGKLRHINVKTLWLQEKALQAELSYTKIKGEDNPADGLTKHVRQELSQRYAKTTSIKLSADRADTSLKLAG